MGRARRRAAFIIATAAVVPAGCSENPSDVTAEELIGLWGGVSVVYTRDRDGASVDLVATEGATYSLQFFPDERYRTQLSGPSVPVWEQSGAYAVRDRQLLLTPEDGSERVLDLSFNGALLTLTERESAWDFDGDGTTEPASLTLVLDRF